VNDSHLELTKKNIPTNSTFLINQQQYLTKTTNIMPQQPTESGQDWGEVNAGRGLGGKRFSVPTSGRELAYAKASGLVTTEKR
jgi:hypothetical protein